MYICVCVCVSMQVQQHFAYMTARWGDRSASRNLTFENFLEKKDVFKSSLSRAGREFL